MLALTAALAMTLYRNEGADLRLAASAKANALAALTTSRLGERMKELVQLSMLSRGDEQSRDVWEILALRAIETGAFRSVSWVDSLGRVVTAFPDERGGSGVSEPSVDAARAAMAQSARTTGQVATSEPVHGASSVPVIVSAAPTPRGAGAVVVETSVPAILQQTLDLSGATGYSVAVYAGGRELYSRRSGPPALEAEWGETAWLGNANRGWTLRAWPTTAELAAHNSRLPETVIVVGVLFALVVAGMTRLYQTADLRARALAESNRRLENEVKERERAQEALVLSEEQLRQSQKMEAVGRLAGGIAHDFNNLLTAINGYAEFLLADIDRNDPRRDDVREIRKAATRAGALTSQLLAFSRRQIRQPRSLDLNAVLTDLERMLRRIIREDVHIDWEPLARLGSVRADPSELEQVMLNLVVNASDAMPNGGTIAVRTTSVTLDGAATGLAPGRYVRLCVSDTGTGMDATTRARIFEPFFTTKEAGKGTGLGLSTVYAIVQSLKGSIDVESAPGKGTMFTVYIPQHDEPADAMGSGTQTILAPRGEETVLLVEDEEGVRALAARILERHGYTVIEARNGRDALSVASQHQGAIHLLLTDVVMPVMGGKQLADALVARDASLRVLFVSGYTDGDISSRGELDPSTAFLQKPFTARGLLVRVRDVLDADALAA